MLNEEKAAQAQFDKNRNDENEIKSFIAKATRYYK